MKIAWIILLWQSWFAVWWWIGAGMYEAESPLKEGEEEEREVSRVELLKGSIVKVMQDGLGGIRQRTGRTKKIGEDDQTENEEIEMLPRNAIREGMPRVDTLGSVATSTTAVTSTASSLLSIMFGRVRKAHKSAAKAAHKDMLAVASRNPTVNDALIGRKIKGWSVSGILKTRQDKVVRTAVSPARWTSNASRDRVVGAQMLGDDVSDRDTWEDVDEYPPRLPQGVSSVPLHSKRWQSWRRKDVTRYEQQSLPK